MIPEGLLNKTSSQILSSLGPIEMLSEESPLVGISE
jgi:hypothetical protein